MSKEDAIDLRVVGSRDVLLSLRFYLLLRFHIELPRSIFTLGPVAGRCAEWRQVHKRGSKRWSRHWGSWACRWRGGVSWVRSWRMWWRNRLRVWFYFRVQSVVRQLQQTAVCGSNVGWTIVAGCWKSAFRWLLFSLGVFSSIIPWLMGCGCGQIYFNFVRGSSDTTGFWEITSVLCLPADTVGGECICLSCCVIFFVNQWLPRTRILPAVDSCLRIFRNWFRTTVICNDAFSLAAGRFGTGWTALLQERSTKFGYDCGRLWLWQTFASEYCSPIWLFEELPCKFAGRFSQPLFLQYQLTSSWQVSTDKLKLPRWQNTGAKLIADKHQAFAFFCWWFLLPQWHVLAIYIYRTTYSQRHAL